MFQQYHLKIFPHWIKVNNWKWSKCSLTGNQINYSRFIQWNMILQLLKNQVINPCHNLNESQRHYVEWKKQHKSSFCTIPLTWNSRTVTTNAIVTESKSVVAGWGRNRNFWHDGNVLYPIWGVGYLCIYNCQNSSIWTSKGCTFHYIYVNYTSIWNIFQKIRLWTFLHYAPKIAKFLPLHRWLADGGWKRESTQSPWLFPVPETVG